MIKNIRILLHIGYGKAGSTFLQNWFYEHPELCVVTTTDIIEFAYKRLDQHPKYYFLSDERFGSWLPHEVLRCKFDEQFNVKKYQSKVCEILKNLFGSSRILIVTRGYKSVLKSGYSQYVSTGGDLGYRDYLDKYLSLFEELYDFNFLIDLYSNAFGEQSLLVLPYELLRDSQEYFLTIIEENLGLTRFRIAKKRANPSISPQELYWYPMISKLVASFAEKFEEPRSSRLYRRHIEYINRKKYHPWVRLIDIYNKKVVDEDYPSEYLLKFKKNGSKLKSNPLYTNYKAEYFL